MFDDPEKIVQPYFINKRKRNYYKYPTQINE